jgi:cell division septation protein DedD
MASGRKSGGDLVLESKHLAGLFLLLVVIFGVVFTLGYLLGRSQYDPKLRAAVSPPAEAASTKSRDNSSGSSAGAENLPAQKSSDWDFYHSGEPKTGEDHLQPSGSPPVFAKSVTAAKSAEAAKPAPKAEGDAKLAPTSAKSTQPAKVEKPATPAKSPAPLNAPLIPKGAVMLQVAAVNSQGDALALAQALQEKKFPAFVIPPNGDKFYRVQVGPYGDGPAATNARHDLEAKGFKSIVKR